MFKSKTPTGKHLCVGRGRDNLKAFDRLKPYYYDKYNLKTHIPDN